MYLNFIDQRCTKIEQTWKCSNHSSFGPWCSDINIPARGFIPWKRSDISCSQFPGACNGPMGWPANGSPSKRETSSRVGAISPHRKWNVWVSGLHLSTKHVRRQLSITMRGHSSVASTRRAKGKSPAHFNLHVKKKYKLHGRIYHTDKVISTDNIWHGQVN